MDISIDYDNTYTKDPEMWLSIISLIQLRGHNVYCVTFRHEHECKDIDQRLIDLCNGKLIATGRKAKFDYTYNILGIDFDIWIDDDPCTITGVQ